MAILYLLSYSYAEFVLNMVEVQNHILAQVKFNFEIPYKFIYIMNKI